MTIKRPPTKSQTYGMPEIFILALNKLMELEIIISKSSLLKKTTQQQLKDEGQLIKVLSFLCKDYKIPESVTSGLTANLFKEDISELSKLIRSKKSFISLSEFVRLALRSYFKNVTRLDLEMFQNLLKEHKIEVKRKRKKKKYNKKTTISEVTANKSMGIPPLFFFSLIELKKYGIIESKSEVIRNAVHKYLEKEKGLIRVLDFLTDNFERDESKKDFLKPTCFNMFCKDIDGMEYIISNFKLYPSKSELVRKGLREFLYSLGYSGFLNIQYRNGLEVEEDNVVMIPKEVKTEVGTTKIIYEKRKIIRKA